MLMWNLLSSKEAADSCPNPGDCVGGGQRQHGQAGPDDADKLQGLCEGNMHQQGKEQPPTRSPSVRHLAYMGYCSAMASSYGVLYLLAA